MREFFVEVIRRQAENDADIFILTGDLGISFFNKFRDTIHNRAINVGVAEANMIGIGAGLALSGKNVYCYSITPFITMRCLEQIRVDVCYQNLNVKLIGSGAGFTYGLEGMTHHAVEDISIMRSLPNMTVVSPGDSLEYEEIARLSVGHKGPIFVRLDTRDRCKIHSDSTRIKIGEGVVINKGDSVSIIVTGGMLPTAKIVTDELRKHGLCPTLISMHTVKPIDKKLILKISKNSDMIFTIEEHSIIGGLGSAVAEVLSESGYRGFFKRFGLPDGFMNVVGNREHLLKECSLNPDGLKNQILKIYRSYMRIRK